MSIGKLPSKKVFQVGGSLPLDAQSYVVRDADEEIYQALQNNEYCYVLNSRQMGKSSLLIRTMQRLQQDNICCASIDLTTIGNQDISAEQWYASIIHDLAITFELEFDLMEWWESHQHLSLIKRVSIFIETILLEQISQRIVIFLDEVDSTLGLSFPCDDFFSWLRACFNRRSQNEKFKRLSFVLIGVATPSDFIGNKRHTPFNIGHSIDLQGFKLEQSLPLIQSLQQRVPEPQTHLAGILSWTNGQPFLTQKLCQLATEYPQQSVQRLVQEHILQNWEAKDEPEHLKTIKNRLLRDESQASRLLGIYQRLLHGETVIASNSPRQMELRLSGLVINSHGYLQIKNKIYQTIFDQDWVEEQFANLRPYSQKFNQWVSNEENAAQFLLEGIELKAALEWAEKKQLSDLDYRFLSACQEYAKQAVEENLASEVLKREEAQIALKVTGDASHMLGLARLAVRETKTASKRRKRWWAGISLLILLCIIGIRQTGVLQSWEWATYDYFFQIRPTPPVDSRITLITIDEADIQTIGQYPLSDSVLATLLNRLDNYQPSGIGLDIYRDLEVEPGHQEIEAAFLNIPNLIGIEKAVGTRISAPPELLNSDQYGFADQILDGDGKIRRALLSIYQSDKVNYSFGLKLALNHLRQQGITPQPLSNKDINLGRATLTPLGKQTGGYIRPDTGGFQVLLNYHGPPKQFESFSLKQVLNNDIDASKIKDRIILIGVTAPTVNDLLLTPFSQSRNGIPTQMPGVFVHANIISQLLCAALDGKPLMKVLGRFSEYLWITSWALLATYIGSIFRKPWAIAISLMLTVTILFFACYLAFLQGWWIPFIPSLLVLISGIITAAWISNRQSEQLILKRLVHQLLDKQKENPAAASVAIEFLKQGERQRNQLLIENIIRKHKDIQ